MQLFQFPLEDVGVGGCEFGFAEAADGVQHIQRPPALGDGNILQRLHATELFSDFLR